MAQSPHPNDFPAPGPAFLAAAVLRRDAMAGGSAATETVAEPRPPPVQTGTEIERFCSNIADAARDRRYALQAQELEQLQKDVDERITLLEEKRAEYENPG